MRNQEHTDECNAATDRWAARMIDADFDRATAHIGTVCREDPDAVMAWFSCPDVTHDSARRGFIMVAPSMPAHSPSRAAAVELANLLA